VTGKLDSDDIRAVVSLRRAAPRLSIGKVIERVRGSRTIKEYLALFLVPGDGRDVTQLRSRFAHVVGDGNIRSLRLEGPLGILAVSAEGRRRLAEEAKAASLTKKKLIERIVARSA
jgi:hypothetical protein